MYAIIQALEMAENHHQRKLTIEEFKAAWDKSTLLSCAIFKCDVMSGKNILKSPYIDRYKEYLVEIGELKLEEVGAGLPELDGVEIPDNWENLKPLENKGFLIEH